MTIQHLFGPYDIEPDKSGGNVTVTVEVTDKTDSGAVMTFLSVCFVAYVDGFGPSYPPIPTPVGEVPFAGAQALIDLGGRPLSDQGFDTSITLSSNTFSGPGTKHKYNVIYRVFQDGNQLNIAKANGYLKDLEFKDRVFDVSDILSLDLMFWPK